MEGLITKGIAACGTAKPSSKRMWSQEKESQSSAAVCRQDPSSGNAYLEGAPTGKTLRDLEIKLEMGIRK